ncbi:MAG: glycoside hydrolase family 97 catalytic domain-containing protein [Sedimentisphaerales bacterium]|nr:glycoside hydrolase family 97 catalytic domain-containing protein [Sedimentisphaerales bacterium]
MNRHQTIIIISTISIITKCMFAGDSGETQNMEIQSPNKKITVTLRLSDTKRVDSQKNQLEYKVDYAGREVISYSPLAIIRADQRFTDNLTFVDAEKSPVINEKYIMPHGKRSDCRNSYTELTMKLRNNDGARLEVITRAYNDGAALRYCFPERSDKIYTVAKELSGFKLPAGGKVWLHPFDRASMYSPAYETYYLDGAAVGTSSPNKEGWAFPVLFNNADSSRWGLITEAGLDPSYCGCRLEQNAPDGLYRIRFPDEGEGNYTGEINPSSNLPWASPWRVIILGDSLSTIVESTLVTDVSPSSIVKDTSWIKPGRASWSWLFDHDSPQDHDKLLKWIDLAAEMGWEYSLIDANWTIMKNGTIHDLIAYANQKGVGLLLWYNSGGPHNAVTEKPRGTMLLRDVRRFEMAMLKRWGIKGIKVDFFQSDKQNIIKLYQDILKDAADHQIMINFHGCTLPRGWSRTYPNLMGMEAVRGEECYSFDRQYPKMALKLNTILPFTRNAVGPMDYTPVMFRDNVYPHLTTYAHELAQAVVFECGWIHFADGSQAYLELPEAPKQFLQEVPAAWDDTKFIDGYPGKYIIVARRKGKQWFLGGLTGENTEQEFNLDLSFLDDGVYKATIICDGAKPRTFNTNKKSLTASDKLKITFSKYGGFAAQLEP